ncbi:glycoside hydrolase family 43 protein [Fulvivirga sp. 29W222]|uniref:Glycoside hydrolase family 43 protein n=1 Tax=Fulvivirga marina TaxID=2494733 RepID=A0A937KEY7_9BACT|nr:glycoside hydrolase family 43 protein [Fulvivirga marina]MBL6447695.1 glycoside hydrolase family 43 protein [Fulvivirga marina]
MRHFLACFFLMGATNLFSQEVNPNPWVMSQDTTARVTYRNPIIPGFYSDPSVCRVGDDYYLITSTFEFFPGVPVFHSKDLVNWEQIGHCIHRKEQIPKDLNIFAATLRYHEGTFYMITTNVASKGNFFVTATDPAGPWSNPKWIDVGGIDPDLFFDDDGRAYVISSTFELTEIDLETGSLKGEKRKVWNGNGGRYPEAPHIYKKDGFYYLMAAEGGTEEAHSVTIARSNTIWGPYINNPANPIVTHTTVAGMGKPIQGVGHGDLVQAHDDSWWMVLHGYRSVADYPPHHTLGRETCLVPVSWPEGSWPVVNKNGSVSVDMTQPTLPQQAFAPKPARDLFNQDKLGLEWNYIQPPHEKNFDLDADKGKLSLKGSKLRIGDKGNPTFVGRRLTDIKFSATTRLQFDPKNDNEEAGMTLVNNGSHFDLMVATQKGQKYLVVKLQFGQTIYRSEVNLKPGPVDLRIEGTGPEFIFSYAQNGEGFKIIERADARFLSTETVGWFTGVYVGLYATGNGSAAKAAAYYDWFEYMRK